LIDINLRAEHISGTEFPGLLNFMPGEWFGLLVGLAFVVIAWVLRERMSQKKRRAMLAE
jgi:hypothetical protein